jgi:lysophospholipase L1-like esterase
MIKALAQKKQIEYVDLNNKLSSNGFLKKEFTVDGTHLAKIAYPVWAEKMIAIITKHKI